MLITEIIYYLDISYQFNFDVFLLVILLIFSGFISGSEVALFSLSKSDIESKSNLKSFKIIANLLEKPNKLLATILIANNLINIAIVILFTKIGEVLFNAIGSPLIQFFVEIVVATFLILLFGEILPKIYASRNNINFSRIIAHPLRILDIIFSPISLPMQKFSNYIKNKLAIQNSNISIDQISHALDLTRPEDTTKQEQKILKGIVNFGNIETKEIMHSRIDIFALDGKLKSEEVLKSITTTNYSRIPVFDENLDRIIGILHIKDLLPFLDKKEFQWKELLREPLFIPENKKLDDLMLEFQEKKVHLAIVVDEYGGTSGLVSLEDVIEEIVGDISDEFDDDNLLYSKIDDHNFIFDGKTSLHDLCRIIKVDKNIFDEYKGEAETIAGFILEISRSFPKKNSKINFMKFVFTIESIDKKRIKQIKLSILNK
ncbi:MAG: gliding motility-associated protein GldE [Flavobacteriaceae bacterium]|nr:gliding motility-associated protein GldE [Flavobacteriaceae bacterium]MBT4113940.1 gliding motility-associated protein GldE [Flavobacteriaceae bacterium]MBT4613860.1 gliding motility-associated protein GldE [Flavobacteriaceae bacterium]MBT5246427.1 gliding motility-associated protein GldE [Flavobacteriaceae bacterium]MBT5650772.1 gliding motility-associated protein GldE [Flavobacteriaceae bacterium]